MCQTLSKIGDYKPFCWSPDKFDTTLQPIQKFLDLQKYQGKWYEIVRAKSIIEFRFDCVENLYKLNLEKGVMNVDIKFHKKNGGIEELNTYADIKNQNNTNWTITFHSFLKGSYFVLDFDEVNYQWALIGEPCRDYFWILSKDENLSTQIINNLLVKANELKFDISQLVYRKDTCQKEISLM